MDNSLYTGSIYIYIGIIFISFIFYTIISKFMLKVNDLFYINNKKSELSICSLPINIFLFFILSIVLYLIKPEYNVIYQTVNIALILSSMTILNLLYLIFSFSYITNKELKLLGIRNKMIYEDISFFKLPILYTISFIYVLITKDKEVLNAMSVLMYALFFGYYKTYVFLGRIKYSYTETFIAKKIEKDLKREKNNSKIIV